MIALFNSVWHAVHVASTTATGFDSPEITKADNRRPMAVFSCPLANVRLLWASLGGALSSASGSFVSDLSTRLALAHPFDSGSELYAHKGGHKMPTLSAHARSEHTFPLTQKEARHAARLWFTGSPTLSLADWRDNRCHAHCCGLPDRPERAEAFRQAFSRELAAIIAGGHSHE